jgi:hypothetical protein
MLIMLLVKVVFKSEHLYWISHSYVDNTTPGKPRVLFIFSR